MSKRRKAEFITHLTTYPAWAPAKETPQRPYLRRFHLPRQPPPPLIASSPTQVCLSFSLCFLPYVSSCSARYSSISQLATNFITDEQTQRLQALPSRSRQKNITLLGSLGRTRSRLQWDLQVGGPSWKFVSRHYFLIPSQKSAWTMLSLKGRTSEQN